MYKLTIDQVFHIYQIGNQFREGSEYDYMSTEELFVLDMLDHCIFPNSVLAAWLKEKRNES